MINYNQYGFEFFGSCNCDGRQTEKYRNGIWQIRHRPKNGTYKFKKHGQSVTEWIDETRAEEYLKTVICLASAN